MNTANPGWVFLAIMLSLIAHDMMWGAAGSFYRRRHLRLGNVSAGSDEPRHLARGRLTNGYLFFGMLVGRGGLCLRAKVVEVPEFRRPPPFRSAIPVRVVDDAVRSQVDHSRTDGVTISDLSRRSGCVPLLWPSTPGAACTSADRGFRADLRDGALET
jgi:hypothetical protein